MKTTPKLIDVMKKHGINWAAIDASLDPSSVIELKSEKDKQGNRTVDHRCPFTVNYRISKLLQLLDS